MKAKEELNWGSGGLTHDERTKTAVDTEGSSGGKNRNRLDCTCRRTRSGKQKWSLSSRAGNQTSSDPVRQILRPRPQPMAGAKLRYGVGVGWPGRLCTSILSSMFFYRPRHQQKNHDPRNPQLSNGDPGNEISWLRPLTYGGRKIERPHRKRKNLGAKQKKDTESE
jgi:hypothetical protein